MWIATNRQLFPSEKTISGFFGDKPNTEYGPKELRFVKLTRDKIRKTVTLKLEKDGLSSRSVKAIERKLEINLISGSLEINADGKWHASLKVASEIFFESQKTKKNILIYVHGYNNDPQDVFETAERLAEEYNLIVVPFTWPSNGGSAVTGTLSYLSDKNDARLSVSAFDRFLHRVVFYLNLLTTKTREKAEKRAAEKFPHSQQERASAYSRYLEDMCSVKITLLSHSMGNYLLKQLARSTASHARNQIFDNIVMTSADVNNLDHAFWVDRMNARKRIYITINEADYVLRAAQIKVGEEQLSRLGQSTHGLDSRIARYVDMTENLHNSGAHSYFLSQISSVRNFFHVSLNGEDYDDKMLFRANNNVFNLIV